MAERLHSDVAMVQAHILAQVSAEKMRHKVNRISASGMALVTQLQSSDGLKAQVSACCRRNLSSVALEVTDACLLR
jgi:hypothetical protein